MVGARKRKQLMSRNAPPKNLIFTKIILHSRILIQSNIQTQKKNVFLKIIILVKVNNYRKPFRCNVGGFLRQRAALILNKNPGRWKKRHKEVVAFKKKNNSKSHSAICALFFRRNYHLYTFVRYDVRNSLFSYLLKHHKRRRPVTIFQTAWLCCERVCVAIISIKEDSSGDAIRIRK